MRPTVSVILPCYNCAKTVTKALDSLVNQTLENIEIIVINDGSTDDTENVLRAYIDEHPNANIQFFSKENEGIAETRNYGLSKVTGEYFGFLDSDDYTVSEMFERLYTCAKNDDLEVAISDFYWENSKGITLQKEGPYEVGPDMMVNLFAVLWNKIYKTDFIKSLDITFPTGNRYEDACFLYCLTMHLSRIGFTNEPYVHYVQQESSITHTNNDQVKNMITVFQIILDYYKSQNKYDEYKEALEYIHIRFFLGNSFLRSAQIEDPKDRKETIMMGWNLLNKEFPNWHNNYYLNHLGGMKNKYFKLVQDWNVMLFAWFFRHFKPSNI